VTTTNSVETTKPQFGVRRPDTVVAQTVQGADLGQRLARIYGHALARAATPLAVVSALDLRQDLSIRQSLVAATSALGSVVPQKCNGDTSVNDEIVSWCDGVIDDRGSHGTPSFADPLTQPSLTSSEDAELVRTAGAGGTV
jgi:hypothetical protein